MNKETDDGVKIYERPKLPPSKVKAIVIVVALLLLIATILFAFYVVF